MHACTSARFLITTPSFEITTHSLLLTRYYSYSYYSYSPRSLRSLVLPSVVFHRCLLFFYCFHSFSNPSPDMTAEFCLEIDSTTCFHWSTSITGLSIRWEYISDPSLLPPVIAHSLTVLLHPSSTQSFLALRFSTVWLPCPDCWLTFPIFLSLFPYFHWQVSVRQLAWICPSLHSWCSIRFSPI